MQLKNLTRIVAFGFWHTAIYATAGRAPSREDGRLSGSSGSVRVGRSMVLVISLMSVAFLLAPQGVAAQRNSDDGAYAVTPLVSSNGAPNTVVDPHLLNAWGLDAGPTSPWWVADNHA